MKISEETKSCSFISQETNEKLGLFDQEINLKSSVIENFLELGWIDPFPLIDSEESKLEQKQVVLDFIQDIEE